VKAVTTEQMRQLDQRTMAASTPGEVLMDRAGLAVARETFELLKPTGARAVLLLAGKGNNGGDAIVAARHLAGAGCEVTLALLCRRGELTGDPLVHFQKLVSNVRVVELPALGELLAATRPSVIVDGLLGTGLTGEVREPYASAIRIINESHIPVLAIDVPSGLGCATCVRANVTLTMGLPKIGLLQPAAVEFIGRLLVADIGFPREFVEEISADVELITAEDVKPLLPARRRDAHKGDFGHLLIVAGSEGYTGAPVLCAHAAARAGTGLVTLAVPRAIYPIVAANCPPEIMPRSLDTLDSLKAFDVVAIGPGLGQSPETQSFVTGFLARLTVPAVVDADALTAKAVAKSPLIFTPHPGEMARLVGSTVKDVQARRWEVAREFARQHGVVLVLKGAGTVVTDPTGKLWINSTGNPGMAKGGSGDVLTGIIGALLAQGLTPLDAARAGVFVHGVAGDIARERQSERSLLASDLIASLGAAFERLD
jgi:ADP-dependent NAD(P)H-hydrate dehydratase / NAD(P)H-hydrate epimerase